jgi:hypothetical protein
MRELGLRRLSMNFAVMGRLFAPDLDFTVRQRAVKAVVSLLNPFFQIKSLHDFNRRFRPTWQPRVVIYEDQRALPQVALLYSGVEGFLSLPLIGKYFVPRRFDPPEPATPSRSPAPAPSPPPVVAPAILDRLPVATRTVLGGPRSRRRGVAS